jgi:low affinity Fe/Cu permease
MNERRDNNSDSNHHSLAARINAPLERFSQAFTTWAGSSWAFAGAVAIVLTWAATGPLFHFSQTWQLLINTGTTIGTFLMVFLIQRAQNKESAAIQVKLNELIAAQQGASNQLINVEDLSEDEVRHLHQRFSKLVEQLDATANERDPHSIAEAQGALEEARASFSRPAPK